MRNRCQNLFAKPVSQQQRTFLVTGRAARTLAAGKSDKELLPAIGASDSCKTFFQITALEILVDRCANHRSPKTILLLEILGIHCLELIEPVPNKFEKRRRFMVPRTVKLCGGASSHDNKSRQKANSVQMYSICQYIARDVNWM